MNLIARMTDAVWQFLRGLGFLMAELWGFMRVRKKFWMAPIFVVLLVFAVLVAFVQNATVAQFIYTLF